MARKAGTKTAEKDEKKEYLERKKRLAAFEEKNYDRIVFLKATKGYYVVGGHSVVILVNKIAPELKIRVAPRRDTDFGVKFKEGVINLKNLDFYKERLIHSVYLFEEFEEKDDALIFKLKKKVSETEYKLLLKSKELRRQKLQAMIEKSTPMPKLNMKLTEVFRVTYKFYVKHSDALSRPFLIQKLSDDIRIAHKTMILIFREQVPARKGLLKIRTQLELAMCDLSQIVALELWSLEDMTTLSILLTEAQVTVEAEIERLEEEEKKQAKDVKIVKELIKNNV